MALQIFFSKFGLDWIAKIRKLPYDTLRGWGETDSWKKNRSPKSRVIVPLSFVETFKVMWQYRKVTFPSYSALSRGCISVVGIDNSESNGSLLLSVLVFVTNLFDNFIVLRLSYSIFFANFIGLKIHFAILLNKSILTSFYAMFSTFIEFPTIIASLILWVLTFLKINFL